MHFFYFGFDFFFFCFFPTADIAFAADCIYDCDATDALLTTFQRLLPPACRIFLSVERRVVFSSVTMEECAPALDYFFERADALSFQLKESKIVVVVWARSTLLCAVECDLLERMVMKDLNCDDVLLFEMKKS